MAAQDTYAQGIIDAINDLRNVFEYRTPVPVMAGNTSFKASSATVITLLGPNSTRKGLILINTDANDLWIKYGLGAGTTSGLWTIKVPAGATWVMDQPIYGGILTGIWTAAGAGVAEITEM